MNNEALRYINRLFAKQARKIRNTIARGVVSLVSDGLKMQGVQIKLLDGEIVEGAERVQQYGFSSHPQEGAECFVAFCGADRSHALVFSVDDRRFRVTGGKPGEVYIYTDEGDQIALKRENTIEVTTKKFVVKAEDSVSIETKAFGVLASESVYIKTANTVFATDGLAFTNQGGGDVTASFQGGLAATDDVKANGGAVSLRGHEHDGVQPGDGNTNKPVGG